MARSIVVALRMSPAGMTSAPEGGYLARARAVCVRGEGLGGRLVAWSTTLLAMGWEVDAIEDAIKFAASIRGESTSRERAWACAVSEGELEALSPTGQGILAWGPALQSAVSLAEVADPGDILVDRALRMSHGSEVSLLSAFEAFEGVGQGPSMPPWQLDLGRPWGSEPGTGEVDSPVDEGLRASESDLPGDAPLSTRIRKLVLGSETALEALAELRRARARADGGPARCQASLALALMLSLSGRAEEALLESLDALARAQETHDPKAIGACMALLAKLYAGAGLSDAATALRESATGG